MIKLYRENRRNNIKREMIGISFMFCVKIQSIGLSYTVCTPQLHFTYASHFNGEFSPEGAVTLKK